MDRPLQWLLYLTTKSHLSLASIDVLSILQGALQTLGYPAVVVFVMIESSGIPFPGETMLLLASFYAAVNHQLNIIIVITCAALGAILGDNIGFYVGRTGGKAIVAKYGHFLHLKPENMDRAQRFFEKHGDKTVFFGRFVAVLRTWAAFLAGVNQMHWRSFFIYNASGGILWAIIYGLLGYYAGQFFHNNFAEVEHLASNITWILAGVIILGVIIAFIVYRRHKKKAEQQA
jgi:membrane protein DedA with SNARE-associated domain